MRQTVQMWLRIPWQIFCQQPLPRQCGLAISVGPNTAAVGTRSDPSVVSSGGRNLHSSTSTGILEDTATQQLDGAVASQAKRQSGRTHVVNHNNLVSHCRSNVVLIEGGQKKIKHRKQRPFRSWTKSAFLFSNAKWHFYVSHAVAFD